MGRLSILESLLILGFVGAVVCDNALVAGLHSQLGSAETTDFCADRLPGLYSVVCGPEVIGCSVDNQQFDLLCPASTWFDQMTHQCVSPSNVADCYSGENTDAIDTGALPVVSSGSCNDLDDGFYSATHCSSSVIYCNNGLPSVFECPLGQVFVAQSGCVEKSEVDVCNGPTADAGQYRAEDDGLFMVEPCSTSFLTCSGGISRIMACPEPLVFDPTLNVCNWKHDVEDCDSKKPEPEGRCAEKKDGMYANGSCSETFLACSGGNEIEMFCPSSLVFDEGRQLCDYPADLAACEANGSGSGDGEGSGSGEEGSGSGEGSGDSDGSGTYGSGEGSGTFAEGSGLSEVTPLGPAVSHTVDGSGEQALGSGGDSSSTEFPGNSSSEDQLLSATETAPSFCSSRGDGFHSLGCSAVLISCKNGAARRLYCPTKTVWDEKLSVCNFRKEVDACMPPVKPNGHSEEFERETFDCDKEGTFADSSCTEQFVLCTSGTGYRLNCDIGLLYSRAQERCVAASELIECTAENTDQ